MTAGSKLYQEGKVGPARKQLEGVLKAAQKLLHEHHTLQFQTHLTLANLCQVEKDVSARIT